MHAHLKLAGSHGLYGLLRFRTVHCSHALHEFSYPVDPELACADHVHEPLASSVRWRCRLPREVKAKAPQADAGAKIELVQAVPLSSDGTWLTTASSSMEGLLLRLDLADWQIKQGELEIDLQASGKPWLLGSGAFGMVHRATLNGSQTVAVKSLLPSCAESARADFLREIAILHDSGSENIVRFLGICICSDKVQLVTEYMDGGDLYHALQDDARRGTLSWYQR